MNTTPDLKTEAYKALDDAGDQIAAILQITNDFKNTSVLLGGFPNALVAVLGKALKENKQFREFFEQAWCHITTGVDEDNN